MENINDNYLAITRLCDLSSFKLANMSEKSINYLLGKTIEESKRWVRESINLGKEKHHIKKIGKIEYDVNINPDYIIRITGKAKIL